MCYRYRIWYTVGPILHCDCSFRDFASTKSINLKNVEVSCLPPDMSFAASERLERLNAYLISKGRLPKTVGTVNYVKKNIGSTVRKRKASETSIPNSNSQTKLNNGASSAKRIQKTPKYSKDLGNISISTPESINSTAKTMQAITHMNMSLNTPQNAATPYSRGAKENKLARTPRKKFGSSKTPKSKNPSASSNEQLKRKLVRRSINILTRHDLNGNVVCTKKQNPVSNRKQRPARIPKTPLTSSNTNSSLTKKVLQCKSAGPKLATAPRVPKTSKLNDQEVKLYEKLNNWLIAKGKEPLDGRKLKGFKPTKTIATPAGSPAHTPKLMNNGGSHWQGLRDEDDSDELTVLIRNTMNDVQKCIDEGCPADIVRNTLEELADKMPGVRTHAKFWVSLIQIEQKSGMSDEKICDLFEKAILAKAQPLDEIKEAINNHALKKLEKPESNEHINSTGIRTSEKSPEKYYNPVPSNQCKTPNPVVERLIRSETPVLKKNAATSPIIFESPQRMTDSPTNVPGSPSSVVKLRMVSKSSPVFNRLKALRALPGEASAIVTPVRRSTRIAAAQENYPKSLQDHEPCLSTVQEILPALEYNLVSSDNANVTCDIVFDPNMALGDSFADLSTVLKF